jgi:hypothetical protein
MKIRWMFFLMVLLNFTGLLSAQIPYPGNNPGRAKIRLNGDRITLENNVVRMVITNDGKSLHIREFTDKESKESLIISNTPVFELTLHGNRIISSDDFTCVSPPAISEIKGDPESRVYAARLSGKKCSANLEYREEGLFLNWEAELRDGSNYLRQIFRFSAKGPDGVSDITPLILPVSPGMHKEGTVDGSPLVNNNMFFALEYPLSKIVERDSFVTSNIRVLIPVISTAWGVTPPGQLRRGFLCYVERERAHPYHQVLHYNSWYDISYHDRIFSENECIDRIKWFGDSLIRKRNVQMKAFLFDDGWDDHTTLWKFHSGFPEGFTNLKKEAELYNSDIGVWLSPFGGYGTAKKSRLDYGRKQDPPFETNKTGFSLAGPVYYNRFREVTGNFIKDYDVSMFKFDGVGAGSGADIVYQKDVEAFLKLLDELMTMKSGLYLSLTTGTWPSVYWLKYGDNIWRGGDDTNIMGEGSKRQQWITYRDADTYKNVVKRGPLYPLNALMLCGICIADYSYPAMFEMDDKDISDEIWSFFATGTNLQELYINPHRLNSSNWDCLADAARWASENEKAMADVHWVGGDPAKGEVYGYAAWSSEKGVLSLRNPSGIRKTFNVNVTDVFEIPGKINRKYVFYNARAMSPGDKKQVVASGISFSIDLQPFEVIVLNAVPLN